MQAVNLSTIIPYYHLFNIFLNFESLNFFSHLLPVLSPDDDKKNNKKDAEPSYTDSHIRRFVIHHTISLAMFEARAFFSSIILQIQNFSVSNQEPATIQAESAM